MNDYTKFNIDLSLCLDCRAFYSVNGHWQRVGANSANNVNKAMTEDEVQSIVEASDIDFSDLKTEAEMLDSLNLPLPE